MCKAVDDEPSVGDGARGGDKSNDWKGWYETNIPVADDRFDEHQAALATKRTKKTTGKATKSTKTSKGKRR